MHPEEVGQRYIYVLQLEGGYFYVGQTPYIARRLDEHKRRKAAGWTKLHKYELFIDKYDAGLCTSKEAESLENEVTFRIMKEHGWRKVRGGNFSAIDDKEIQCVMIKYRNKYNIDNDLYNILLNDLDDEQRAGLARYIKK